MYKEPTYTVCEPYDLQGLCIRKDWFTCGSTRQYDKLFKANRSGASMKDIAVIIWLCSDTDEGTTPTDILAVLRECEEHLEYCDNFKAINDL